MTILEMLPALSNGGNVVHESAVSWRLEQLKSAGSQYEALEITSEGVVGDGPDGTLLYKGESLLSRQAADRCGLWRKRSAIARLSFIRLETLFPLEIL